MPWPVDERLKGANILIKFKVEIEVKEDNRISENGIEEEFCVWSSGNGSVNYDTECGHTYFPYVKTFDQPHPIEDREYDICPWCGKKIEYNDEND